MRGAFNEILNQNIPQEAVSSMKESVDCTVYCFGNSVSIPTMYAFISAVVLVLVGVYILLNAIKYKKSTK